MELKKYLEKSMSYEEYWDFFEKLVKEGRTNWHEQSEEMIQYTKLNFQRSRRIHKRFKEIEELAAELKNIKEPITWLAISEPWCGDASQNLPIFYELSQRSDLLDLRIVLRDENPELMEAFLTNGAKSIPKIIQLDRDLNVLETWGPRPMPAQEKIMEAKLKPWLNKQSLYEDLQTWYNKDMSRTLQKEIIIMLKKGVNA